MCGWTIQEWPYSRALGERWVAFPPPTPPGEKWPGLRFFPSRVAAVAEVGEVGDDDSAEDRERNRAAAAAVAARIAQHPHPRRR